MKAGNLMPLLIIYEVIIEMTLACNETHPPSTLKRGLPPLLKKRGDKQPLNAIILLKNITYSTY